MRWPQITYIVLIAMSGTITLLKHGDATKYNFWAWLTSLAITMFLLVSGGFFRDAQ